MKIIFFALTLLLASTHSFAKEKKDPCHQAFNDLLRWRTRTLLLGQDSKYKNDCLIETKRKEINRTRLSPQCQLLPFKGSALEEDRDLKTALDPKNEFFSNEQLKKTKALRLTDIYYQIVESTLNDNRLKCQEKPSEPNL